MVSLCSLPSFFLSFSFVLLSPFSNFIDAQAQGFDYPTTQLSTRWTINATANQFTQYDGSIWQAILLQGKETSDPTFACGFYCNGIYNSWLFVVFIVQLDNSGLIVESDILQVVWCANRNNPVKSGATLELTSEGDLVLKDADGTVAWSPNTSAKSVVGLNLTDFGNLVLFDEDNVTVWQSFDHPTDSLVPGQKLRQGQRLTTSVSETYWIVDGMISLSINGNVLFAQVEMYLKLNISSIKFSYVEFENGSLSLFSNSTSNKIVTSKSLAQYMKLGSDGHLRVYELDSKEWKEVADLFEGYVRYCAYPMLCGRYGICSNGQCSCPASSERTSYFQQIDDMRPNLTCFENVPLSCDAQARDYDYPTAPLSTRWTINAPATPLTQHGDGSVVQAILLQGKEAFTPAYACGFYCNGSCNSYLFAVFIIQLDESGWIAKNPFPRVVWSTNRNNPVKIGATLELTSKGDLVLKDADGTIAWSTNTSTKSVVGLNLTDLGNLVLFDKDNVTVWQSFDHPTDSLVLRQKLRQGQRLTVNASETNRTFDGTISLFVNGNVLSAQVETDPPQIYFERGILDLNTSVKISYVEFENGSLSWFPDSTSNGSFISVPPASSAQYMKLGSDGHLRVYEFAYSDGWKEVADLFKGYVGDCAYPTVCGRYGICSNGQCGCPPSNYFQQVDYRKPNLGCFENVPLSCEASENQNLLELQNVAFFGLIPDVENTNASSCKEACAKNCSCYAAIFKYFSDPTSGDCYLPTQVFSLINVDKESYNSTAYLKIQNVANEATSNRLPVILGSSFGALFAMIILVIAIVLFVQKRDDNQAEEDHLDQVLGKTNRFMYNDLKTITDEFGKKLGKGGFGSVFEGTLSDGTKVAVKHLDGFGQVKKSFLAEVETIGSIHHVNLVRLMGFCAEKSHRLLIYEYMSNGSLDRWIFHKSNECVLDWQQRKKIILDIAKGLNYLHEDCRQKIVHLDIKPQNILLGGNFNAKVADFGLSKLIDRDQSHVFTAMRGTPGYLAPEWLRAAITEKVDVYSFGVVILEIVCGRKIFDRSLDEEGMDLLSLFKRKAEEERLLDIVDKSSDDMQLNGLQAVDMMRIAAWCLQGDYTKRPSMSTVIKVLRGHCGSSKRLGLQLLCSGFHWWSSKIRSDGCRI